MGPVSVRSQQSQPRTLWPATSGSGSTTPQGADLLGWAVSPFVHLLSTACLPELESETPSKEH